MTVMNKEPPRLGRARVCVHSLTQVLDGLWGRVDLMKSNLKSASERRSTFRSDRPQKVGCIGVYTPNSWWIGPEIEVNQQALSAL